VSVRGLSLQSEQLTCVCLCVQAAAKQSSSSESSSGSSSDSDSSSEEVQVKKRESDAEDPTDNAPLVREAGERETEIERERKRERVKECRKVFGERAVAHDAVLWQDRSGSCCVCLTSKAKSEDDELIQCDFCGMEVCVDVCVCVHV
jgi:hypothetical protein